MLMVSSEQETVLISLVISRLSTDHDLVGGAPCLDCGEPLSIHQPDLNAPERLLGTCDACGAWHLIDADRAVTVLLPDADGLRIAAAP